MSDNKNLQPRAEILIESLRSIGYSFQSAVADIVDNSLSAEATEISIKYNPSLNNIVFTDNGYGMNNTELEEAMRFGSKDPLISRSQKDLGRFGLGLNTASLSQCRKFSVFSIKDGKINGYAWDLDIVRDTGDWTVIKYNSKEVSKNKYAIALSQMKSGTCVIWENFDKISVTSRSLKETIETLIDESRDYLALVFHLYINEGVKIIVNNIELKSIDPFLSKSTFTQKFKVEPLDIYDTDGKKQRIKVTPYVLPHFSSLTENEREMVGGKDNYKNKQGFYIYRNKRLIIWGTWFRIVAHNELYRNARVMVEIPNTLDYIWSVDVKKSSASIPPLIRQKLFHSVNQAISSSKNIYTKRARNINKDLGYSCVWDTIVDRDRTSYKINRDLPIIQALTNHLDDNDIKLLEFIFNDIENNLPKYEIYTKLSEGKDDNEKEEANIIKERVLSFFKFSNIIEKSEIENVLNSLFKSEPYCNYTELKDKIKKELIK